MLTSVASVSSSTEVAPDAFVSLPPPRSAARQGEYERTVAAVINSYVGPASVDYLDCLVDRLSEAGFNGRLLVMQCNGGVTDVDHAQSNPIRLLGSGPAGGASGVAVLAARAGQRNLIATHIGGTSFEVGLLIDGRPVVSGQQIIDQYTFHQPHLDVRSIACGGGSIASIAPDGGLRVGPHSAGSSPGPACYGRGGTQPTVTDADVVLGLLSPDSFLGGGMRLDADAARVAVALIAWSHAGAECRGRGRRASSAVNNHAAATPDPASGRSSRGSTRGTSWSMRTAAQVPSTRGGTRQSSGQSRSWSLSATAPRRYRRTGSQPATSSNTTRSSVAREARSIRRSCRPQSTRRKRARDEGCP